jgi:murein DD-endopeptidase MepM/ murein hydrolase activator NlpD
VVYAGDDSDVIFGPRNDFYGNLVVIEHDARTPWGEPLFTLYGHMSRVEVETGDQVMVQQVIGQVGSTGVAMGSHLHLEVRAGDPYDYGSTYNPDLWLRPWNDYGTLAGRIYDAHGERLYGTQITIEPVRQGVGRTTYAYADGSVNSDPYYGEHFTYGDLRAGEYEVIVRINGVARFKEKVNVTAGETAWIEIRLN